jgi:hypothetical protein
MLVVSYYNYLPGACALCLSSNLPAVDTNVDLDWPNSPDDPNPSANRRLYICADCCINLADMVKESRDIELKPAQMYAELQSLNNEMGRTNVALNQRIGELEQALSVMRTISTPTVEVDPQMDVTPFAVTAPPPTRAKK